MASDIQNIPKGLFEIADLHPDQLAQYGITGDRPGFEKFLINAGIGIIGDWFSETNDFWRRYKESRFWIPYNLLEIAWPDDPVRLGAFVGPPAPPVPEVMTPIGPDIYEIHENSLGPNFIGPAPIGKIGLTTGDAQHDDGWKGVSNLFSEIGMLQGLTPGVDSYNPSEASKYNIVIRETTARVNSVLEERSFLDFEFPNPDIGVRRVCMFENPEMTETRTPSYAKQPIMQRNEPARLYVGAEARKVNLRFNYTLPLVEEFLYKSFNKPVGWNSIIGDADTTKVKYAEYLRDSLSEQFGGTFYEAGLSPGKGEWELKPSPIRGPQIWDGYNPIDAMSTPVNAGGPFPAALNSWSIDAQTMTAPLMEAIAYTHFVLDTIRTSVIGDRSSADSSKVWGPPIVKFRHGTIFEQDPWVVTSYSINYDHTAGMDPRTLLPRRVRFTLDLEEFHQTTGAHHGEHNMDLPGASDIMNLESNARHSGYGSRKEVKL